MGWVRVDDGMMDHPKIISLSDAAFRLHMKALCWCSRFRTDGRIPPDWPGLSRRTVLRESLIRLQLWVPLTEGEYAGGYEIHDFLKYNPSAQEIKELTESRAKAGRRGGVAKALANAKANAKQNPSKHPSKILANTLALPSPSPEESYSGTQSKPPTSSCSGGGEAESPPSRVLAAQGRAEHLKAKMMAEVQKTRRVPWVFPETEIRHIRGLLQGGLPVDAILAAWRAYVGAMKDPAKISVYYFTANVNQWTAEAARSKGRE